MYVCVCVCVCVCVINEYKISNFFLFKMGSLRSVVANALNCDI